MKIEILPGNAVRVDHTCDACGDRVRWDGRLHENQTGQHALHGVCGCQSQVWVFPLGPAHAENC